jgi:hypothetical protein
MKSGGEIAAESLLGNDPYIQMRLGVSGYGSDRTRTPWTTLYTAELAPIASASVNTAETVNRRSFVNVRMAKRRSSDNPDIACLLPRLDDEAGSNVAALSERRDGGPACEPRHRPSQGFES